jgi:hypothetical protein
LYRLTTVNFPLSGFLLVSNTVRSSKLFAGSGKAFASLQARSHWRQPMQRDRSIRQPHALGGALECDAADLRGVAAITPAAPITLRNSRREKDIVFLRSSCRAYPGVAGVRLQNHGRHIGSACLPS